MGGAAVVSDRKACEPQTLVKVRDLRTYFPVHRGPLGRTVAYVRAVDGVSFDIEGGTTLGLVGESGCGKTTVGRTILRLAHATSGCVWFEDSDVLAASRTILRRLRRNMQMVFQDASGSLNPRMSVGRIVGEPLTLHCVARGPKWRECVATLLTRVGLRTADADRYPHELSGGQRQRVGIARAIALNPKFVVCDEPVSALDVSIQAQILNLLNGLKRELGLTYLFIAHDLSVVEHFSDRVAVMYLGKIVEIADAAELYEKPRHPYTVALLSAVPEPDPHRRPERIVVAGDVPSPIDPPPGCAFHPRCPIATGECSRVTPSLQSYTGLPPGHLVACHHVSKTGSSSPPGRRS
ncbi:MAG: ATP-binding cassette domain-containing protein [Phycisphaerales bacterium]|nr:MAG: ATP-binding cassette domain-containing protein [Phycisphaerales bacterium]